MQMIRLHIKSLRPKQWVKNILVASAPLADGQALQVPLKIFFGVIGFMAASSLGYLINDWIDKDIDRNHPKKSKRPFASGSLKKANLYFLLIVLTLIIVTSCLVLPKTYAIAILVYLFITFSYSFKIKKIPVLEMIWLSSGFLVRAVAGSAIIQEPPTGWFVVSIGFGALFIVSAKRLAELNNKILVEKREVIKKYNEGFLNTILTSSIGITLLTYSLWVFEVHPNSILAQFSILPFSLSVFLYAWHCEMGDAEEPESLIFKDKLIVISSLVTAFTLFLVVYL